ncbi:energy transducer TonB [Adhaeribacter sp. BT258]|uniref:Energy transducer TonB n=1 Tax=Adhaeribacter terrigena TaxID=2793070 RepID=A0ABS1C4V0_9BACT|nr:energy transducer TonB [Adhaeribacter terrigena]MBK0404409.1 energy transducer TonB [Adhaeribacter terrigena]
MKQLLLFTAFLIAFFPSWAQDQDNGIYQMVEQLPQFPGGDLELQQHLQKSFIYPEAAIKQELQGLGVYSFVVNKDGSLSDLTVLKPVGEALDQEGLRMLKAMPLWIPGKINGRIVRVKFTLPLRFTLEDKQVRLRNAPTITKGYATVTKNPEFPGGQEAMERFLTENLKYPKALRKKGIEGTVVVKFQVTETGALQNPIIMKSIDPALDAEALRIINEMPAWEPARFGERKVAVPFYVPVTFSNASAKKAKHKN